MHEASEVVAAFAFMLIAFLGAVWIVEHSAVGFWKWAIRNSEHCRMSGCVCPCHDARDTADHEIERAAKRLGVRP